MSNAKITVWHDLQGGRQRIISLQDETTAIRHEFVRESEEVAIAAAKNLGAALSRPVFLRKNDGSEELVQK